MQRLATLAVVALAVVALATVATTLPTVSVQPSIEPAGTPELGPPRNSSAGGGGGGNGTATADDRARTPASTATAAADTQQQLPLWQVVTGLLFVLSGSLLALYGLTRGVEDDTEREETPPEPATQLSDSGRLTSDVPATNDVYRAWNALCDTVSIDPAGKTPADVAEAAISDGFQAQAVTDLTDLFCAVRYGDAAPTDDREQRARQLTDRLSLSVREEP